MRVKKYFLVFVLSLFFNQTVFANVGESFGFGSRTSALGGAGVAWGSGAFAAYHNPAALSVETEKRIKVGYGFVYAQPNFLPIKNVVTQNKYIADATSYGDVDTSYKDTFGQQLGLSVRLFPELFNLSVGIASFLPVNQLAYLDSGEAYIPEYILYRARTQRPQFELGVGADLGAGLKLGAGLHLGFTMTGNANLFLNTRTTTTSSIRFSASLQPKVSPYFGLLFTPQDDPKRYSLGAVIRFPLSSENTMKLTSAARVFGDFAAVDFNFTAFSTMFYDPYTLELGWSYLLFDRMRTYFQLDYQAWKLFKAPALIIQQPQTTKCDPTSANPGACGTVQIAPGAAPSYSYDNIIIPRIGEEFTLSDTIALRVGYAYRPSIISGAQSDVGNYLDPAKHMVNLGLGISGTKLMDYDLPWNLDFNFLFQYLVRQNITKTPGNEAGDPTDLKIAAPGYTAGGTVAGGGVTLSVVF